MTEQTSRTVLEALEVVAAAQAWRRSLIPNTSTAGARETASLVRALDRLTDAALDAWAAT
jgi:hypothetical protein